MYYTRSRREHGRVLREYVGTGVAGQAAADGDEATRAARASQKAEFEAQVARLHGIETSVENLGKELEALARQVLEASDLRLHRGEWRRRRER